MAGILLQCQTKGGFGEYGEAASLQDVRPHWAEAVWKRGGDVGGVSDQSISGDWVRIVGTSRSPRLWEGDLTATDRPHVAPNDCDQPCMACISPLTPSKATIRLML